MPINARSKGGNGEREVATLLNGIIGITMRDAGLPDDQVRKGFVQVQRNQNQSAVGGKDFVGTFDLSIEIKRQEILCVPAWWRQCCEDAEAWETPVLIYRQNRSPWFVVMNGQVPVNGNESITFPVTITWDRFVQWFRAYVKAQIGSANSG